MGNLFSKSVEFKPDNDIPSLRGKVILVTGGNSGLGRQSILELCKHNPREIWLAARSVEKADEAIASLMNDGHDVSSIKVLELDLASFESVQRAAQTFTAEQSRLDILLLNAGIMAVPPGLTKEGYEVQFGTNHMGHALLVKLLLPTLLSTAEKPNSDVRVVVLGSGAHNSAPKGGIRYETLKNEAQNISTVRRYGQSKLANILFGKELAKRYPQLKVPIVHPGIVRTNLGNTVSSNSLVMKWMWVLASNIGGVNVSTGALNQLWAATNKDVKSGEYYEPIGVQNKGSKYAKDEKLAKDLWEWTEKELSEPVES